MNASTLKNPERETLLPQAESHRVLPVNLRQEEADLFQHELTKSIPAVQLLEFHNVRISAEGILFKRGRILRESFPFPSMFDDWKTRSVAKFMARNYLARRTRRVHKEALWIVDEWSTGYFHWLTDALSKLVLLGDRTKDRVLLLPHHYERFEFVRASLKAFGIDDYEFIGAGEVFQCDKLMLTTPVAPSGHYREDIIQRVRERLVSYYGATIPNSDRRVYISRAQAPKRKLANEEQVLDVLGSFNFEVILSENLSFADQLRIASQARYLISNHGAGLTNMLFMSSGSNVLELRHRQDRVNNCYFTLSSALDLNYFYQSCDSLRPEEDPHTADLDVDITTLRKNIELMLAAG